MTTEFLWGLAVGLMIAATVTLGLYVAHHRAIRRAARTRARRLQVAASFQRPDEVIARMVRRGLI